MYWTDYSVSSVEEASPSHNEDISPPSQHPQHPEYTYRDPGDDI